MASERNAHTAVLGLSHRTSSAEIRDRLLFTERNIERGLKALVARRGIDEAAILSTCNRVELYACGVDPESMRDEMTAFLSDFHGVAVDAIEPHVFFCHCEKAVRHLFNVIASLDSMVVGESQILAQVKEAYRTACHAGTTGQYLNKLFHFGISVGKRVRAETRIGEGVVSIASAAVALAEKIVGRLDHSTALVIGAGEMSKLTARHLCHAGLGRLYFANRTVERAAEMASLFGGTALALDDWPAVLPSCDIVISSTGAPHYVVTAAKVREAMSRRKNRPVFLIDIAAPRDIEPAAGDIYNVFLYGIDDLQSVVGENSRMRREEIGRAVAIIDETVAMYRKWYAAREVLPTLVTLRRNFEEIRDGELERYASEISALPEQARDVMSRFALSLTDKFLHMPSVVLKEKAQEHDGVHYAHAIADLFGLRRK